MVSHFVFVKNCGGHWGATERTNLGRQLSLGWDVSNRTPNKKLPELGDKVLLYVSGKKAGVFVGEATISNGFARPSDALATRLNKCPYVLCADYVLKFSGFQFWDVPVSLATALNKVDFISNKKIPGLSLRQGIIPISPNDYQEIRNL